MPILLFTFIFLLAFAAAQKSAWIAKVVMEKHSDYHYFFW